MQAPPKTQAGTAKRPVMRFSLRTLLLAVFVLCVVFALWEQHRRLQSANSVLDAHGLTWSLEPLKKETFRVFINEVVNDHDTQVRQITIETLGEPEIAILHANGKRVPAKSGVPTPNTGTATRSRFTIVANQRAQGVDDDSRFGVVDVRVRLDRGGSVWIFSRHTSGIGAPKIHDVLKIKLKPGEYPRGTPVDLLELDMGRGQPETIQLIVD